MNLRSLVIPDNVTTIGEEAFWHCSKLTTVLLGSSVKDIGDRAFADCSDLTSVTIPESVTSIGNRAFDDCPSLTSIAVENGNPVYDSRGNCNAIIKTATNTLISGCKNTMIPNSVTSIGDHAFRNCSGLTTVTIPNSVTSIGNWAFYQCDGLTSVTIPESVTSIGESAFADCYGLNEIHWTPNADTDLSLSMANAYLTSTSRTLYLNKTADNAAMVDHLVSSLAGKFKEIIVNINFVDDNVKALCVANWDTNHDGELSYNEAVAVTDLGEVFKGNTEITSFDELQYFTGLTDSPLPIHFALSTWKTSAKYDNIVITSDGTTLYQNDFSNESLTDWTNGGGQWQVINGALCQTDTGMEGNLFTLNSLTLGNNYTIDLDATKVEGEEGFLIGFNVADARNRCWWNIGGWSNNKTQLEEMIDGMNNPVGNESSLTVENGRTYHITIAVNNGNVKCYLDGEQIHDYNFTVLEETLNHAFEGCSNLTSVSIPESVTTIGEYAFSGCSSLTSVTIPENVTSINKDAFSGCSNLTSVTIPNSVTLIGYGAFYDCSSLTSITIPESVTSIDEWTFAECKSLTSITIPESVTSIAEWAFAGCTGLTMVTIPNSVTSIHAESFYGCSGLTSVTIPNSVTSIGHSFGSCPNVTSIVVEEGNPVYDSRENCNAIIETSTNTIVQGCKNTTIPNSVTKIGTGAFSGSWSMNSVTIPNSITTIERDAFAHCITLTQVISQIEEPFEFGEYAFYHISDQCALYVPVGTKDAYIAAGWTEDIFKGGIWESTPDKRAIDAMYDLMASTNVYTQEAYDTYKALADGYMAQYEAGTSNKNVVNPYGNNGMRVSGLDYTSFLLSAWTIDGEQCVDYNKALYINTWSTEGIYDGSEMKVPFYEYFIDDDNSLANNTLSATVEGITPGVYDVEILARVRLRDDRNETPTGITMSVNGGEAVDLCSGTQSENANYSQMYYGTFKATGVVGADGILTININVVGTNCSWLAFKNVKYSKCTDNLYVEDCKCLKGVQTTIPVMMKNEKSITAFQFEVELPEGVTLSACELTDRKKSGHTMSSSLLPNGNYQVTCISLSSEAFSGNDGALVNLTIDVDNNMAAGDYTYSIKNVELTTTGAIAILPEDESATMTVSNVKLGDVNADDKVTITDAVAIVNYILNNPPTTFVYDVADVNGDNRVSITDAVAIVNMILAGQNDANIRETETLLRIADTLDPE